ncbi:MAG: bifunctional folylpolyglutamate synthase/dihydrofolate synthase [Candidatus Omnitrophica bacterium]|nr:bifunctional folylpolyglutamate synthase/dihydrofolate synthase [Candidatus Omnitrophota bacterium]
MTYPEAISYLNSFTDYEKHTQYSYKKDLKLARIRGFLAIIGNPQKFLRIIHIAGTKGKGSTCALVAYILKAAGFSVGLYTSPHLNDFRERIRILLPFVGNRRRMAKDFEGMISKKELSALVKELKPLINKYNRYSKYGQLSFFEVYTALAFLYFKRQQIDFAVLETGMGGRLDATNVAKSLVCGITPLSFEHTQKLGNTLAKIAAEKAGIIKHNGAIVISAWQAKEAREIIHNRCKKFQARLYEVGRQIKYSQSKRGLVIKGLKNDYKNLHLDLLGAHQAANAALAVGLVEALSFYGFNIQASAIRQGLDNAVWPGRCELAQRNPLIILDGAQNLASARVLRSAVEDNFQYRKLILVLGISDDKDIAGICKTLSPLADEVILTRAATSRAADPAKLAGYFKRKLLLTRSVKEAKLLARSLAGKKDLILVTGSLFVVGEFRDVGR